MARKLPVTTGNTAMQLAKSMFGSGIKIMSATYSGDPLSQGLYSSGEKFAPGVLPSDTGVILSTGRASDFTNSSGKASQTASKPYNSKGLDNTTDRNAIAGAKTFDAAIFEAKFVPEGSVLTMQVTFASGEYLENVGSGFNDAVGVWVNGEKAKRRVGNGNISIDNISDKTNSALYFDNAKDQFSAGMDGFTVTLTLKAKVTPGQVNSIKIGIADAGDAACDSNLLIAGDSIQTALVATDDSFKIGLNDKDLSGAGLTTARVNGQPVGAGSVVPLSNGLEVVVNGDGTISLHRDPSDREGDASLSHKVTNSKGITDVGFVKEVLVPCFVQGALIATTRGPVPVERVRVGDLVQTLDHGFQPVRWHGTRAARSEGAMARVHISAGVLGAQRDLAVSAQHRLRLSGGRAQLFLGKPDVLVKARHLVDLGVLKQDTSGEEVIYHHLLFDRHEIILAGGIWSESFHPGPMSLPDRQIPAEVLRLFPALCADDDAGYGPIARQECSLRETAVLIG